MLALMSMQGIAAALPGIVAALWLIFLACGESSDCKSIQQCQKSMARFIGACRLTFGAAVLAGRAGAQWIACEQSIYNKSKQHGALLPAHGRAG
jgi:hypothetical protein